jgi:DNA-binding Lrp family transcriptional regulator
VKRAQRFLLDEIDCAIIRATQTGLPLVQRPYHAVAASVGVPEDEVMRRMTAMLAAGVIRRIGVVPNHYALGYRANGMTVWDVEDTVVDELGEKIGALDFVSHCYRRPRFPPHWSYNLFAMVHGKSRAEVEQKTAQIAALLETACRGHEILYSTRILKKTGLRLHSRSPENDPATTEDTEN